MIVTFNDEPINNLEEMHEMLSEHQAGDTVRLTIQRGNTQTTISVVLGEGMAF